MRKLLVLIAIFALVIGSQCSMLLPAFAHSAQAVHAPDTVHSDTSHGDYTCHHGAEYPEENCESKCSKWLAFPAKVKPFQKFAPLAESKQLTQLLASALTPVSMEVGLNRYLKSQSQATHLSFWSVYAQTSRLRI